MKHRMVGKTAKIVKERKSGDELSFVGRKGDTVIIKTGPHLSASMAVAYTYNTSTTLLQYIPLTHLRYLNNKEVKT